MQAKLDILIAFCPLVVVCCCESSWGKWVKMEPGLQISCIGSEVCEIPNLIILETYISKTRSKKGLKLLTLELHYSKGRMGFGYAVTEKFGTYSQRGLWMTRRSSPLSIFRKGFLFEAMVLNENIRFVLNIFCYESWK